MICMHYIYVCMYVHIYVYVPLVYDGYPQKLSRDSTTVHTILSHIYIRILVVRFNPRLRHYCDSLYPGCGIQRRGGRGVFEFQYVPHRYGVEVQYVPTGIGSIAETWLLHVRGWWSVERLFIFNLFIRRFTCTQNNIHICIIGHQEGLLFQPPKEQRQISLFETQKNTSCRKTSIRNMM